VQSLVVPSVTRLGLCLAVPYVCSYGIAPYLGLDTELLVVVQRRYFILPSPTRAFFRTGIALSWPTKVVLTVVGVRSPHMIYMKKKLHVYALFSCKILIPFRSRPCQNTRINRQTILVIMRFI
jgi:hypothetical protein